MADQLTNEQIQQIYAARPDVQQAFQANPSKMSEAKRATNWYNTYLAGGGQSLFTPGGTYSGQNVIQAMTNPASPYDYTDPYGARAAIGTKLGLDTATSAEQAAQAALLGFQDTTRAQINALRANRDLSTGLEAGFEAQRTREATQQEQVLANELTLAQQKRLALEGKVESEYQVFQQERGKREDLLLEGYKYGATGLDINMSVGDLASKVYKAQEDYIENQAKKEWKQKLKEMALSLGIKTKGLSAGEIEKKIAKRNKKAYEQAEEEHNLKIEAAKLDMKNTRSIMAERGKKGSSRSSISNTEKRDKAFESAAKSLVDKVLSGKMNREQAKAQLDNFYPDYDSNVIYSLVPDNYEQ